MQKIIKLLIIFILIILYSCSAGEFENNRVAYPEEVNSKIGRGLVCFSNENGNNFLSWRKLPKDSLVQQYFVWRKSYITSDSIIENIGKTESTFYVDEPKNSNQYYGISTDKKKLPEIFERTRVNNNDEFNAIEFNLPEDYKQAVVVTGDLTGDGELEFLISYSKMKAVDPFEKAWMKSTDTFKLLAFKKDGSVIWKFDLGFGIEAGRNFAPIVVWDLDADGKCEVILKTNKSQDPRNYNEEYITILDGGSGKIERETRWPDPPSDNFNSNSRNYLAIAHLDGKNPSIIVGRGLYHAQVICAYDKYLNKEWERILGSDLKSKFENKYLRKLYGLFFNDKSRGSHSLPIADVDENGTEEIFWGEHVITEGGEDLWKIDEKTPYSGHLDIVYPADIIDSLPGKETYYCREGWGSESDLIGVILADSRGEIIWSKWGYTHVDGGWASKVIPGRRGWQFFGYDVQKKNWEPGEHSFTDPNQFLLDSSGNLISNHDSTWIGSFTVDWEGDGIKEICTKYGEIKRYNQESLLKLKKGGILWCGDILGDHREEIVYAPKDGKVYIITNTLELNVKPEITKLADRQYRNDLSRTAMQFNLIPTESGFIFHNNQGN